MDPDGMRLRFYIESAIEATLKVYQILDPHSSPVGLKKEIVAAYFETFKRAERAYHNPARPLPVPASSMSPLVGTQRTRG